MNSLKKKPRKQLEKFSTIFMQIGLVLTLFVVYAFMEHETEEKQVKSSDMLVSKTVTLNPDEVPIFTKEVKQEPKIKTDVPKKLILDEPIEKVDNTKDETPIITKEDDKEVPVFDLDSVTIVDEPKDPIVENVPYTFVERTPIFKGCEGLPEKENKACFDKKMKKFIQRNFDVDLGSKLNLRTGKHKIYTQFVIDDKGDVVDIKINAPHVKLKQETLDLIEKLPKFTPGKQQNKTVKVKYTLPITFYVD